MEQKNRRAVGQGYEQEFDLRKPASSSLVSEAVSQPRESSEVSRRLETLWWSEGGERGGDELDEFLTGLGDSYIEGGRVKWDLPADLNPIFVDYFSRSVEELNKQIDLGVISIDEDGNIRPA